MVLLLINRLNVERTAWGAQQLLQLVQCLTKIQIMVL